MQWLLFKELNATVNKVWQVKQSVLLSEIIGGRWLELNNSHLLWIRSYIFKPKRVSAASAPWVSNLDREGSRFLDSCIYLGQSSSVEDRTSNVISAGGEQGAVINNENANLKESHLGPFELFCNCSCRNGSWFHWKLSVLLIKSC